MQRIFLVSTVISVIYVLIRFIEMRFILKENKPLKDIIRDTIVVYISAISGIFIIEQVKPIKNMANTVIGSVNKNPGAFVDEPSF